MTEKEILAELRSLGTEQNRKIYSRHGVQGEMFGVSYANLEKLRKKIKTDHMLAGQLWAAGNHDARILAIERRWSGGRNRNQNGRGARDG
jgi:3-methyladenine DNA glycosylase AlkD